MGTSCLLMVSSGSLAQKKNILTTWLIWETLDWRMVTASPIDGFFELATVEALKALVERAVSC